MESRKTLIVGGSPVPSPLKLVENLKELTDDCIAVDSGADLLCELDSLPALYVGDGDSISSAAMAWLYDNGVGAKIAPAEKDDTDLALALDTLRDAEDSVPMLTSVTGGRLDHQLGVLGTLARRRRMAPVIREEGFAAWILAPEGRTSVSLGGEEAEALVNAYAPDTLPPDFPRGATLSVIPLLENTEVTVTGTKWVLHDEPLPVLADRGVSNVIVSDNAEVTCSKGCAIVWLGIS